MAVQLASGLVVTVAADLRPTQIRRTILRTLQQPGSESGLRVRELATRTHYTVDQVQQALNELAVDGRVTRDVAYGACGLIVTRWAAITP